MPSTCWDQFETYAGQLVNRHQLPGISLAVAREGEILYGKAFGYRDREEQKPATVGTVYGIGSVTKSFTAIAIMQLEEAGRLSVYDPVVRYLPEFRLRNHQNHAEAITIHHFLTHTSGLPPMTSLYYAMADSMKTDPVVTGMAGAVQALERHPPIRTYEELMAFVAQLDLELLGPPGRHFSYCNEGYSLLGCIIERLGGRPYQQYVEEHVLYPAGMNRSTFHQPVMATYPEVTQLYAVRGTDDQAEPERAPVWWEAPAMAAAGFLRSNVEDLIRYLEIYRTRGKVGRERVLAESSVDRMLTPYATGLGGAYGYGLKLTSNYHGVSLVEHGGGIKGVAAQITCVPQAGITGAALANLAGAPSSQILLGAVNVLLGLPVNSWRHPRREYRYPVHHLQRLAGVYPSAEGLTAPLTLTVRDGSLVASIGAKSYPVRMAGPYTCCVEMKSPDDETVPSEFIRNDAGEVTALSTGGRMLLKQPLPEGGA